MEGSVFLGGYEDIACAEAALAAICLGSQT
jgi:hypothetical protein